MSAPTLDRIGNFYHSPGVIAVSRADKFLVGQVKDVLLQDGYAEFIPANPDDYKKSDRTLFLATRGNNFYLFDDWSYSLHYNTELQTRIRSLTKADLYFYGWIGDADDSFEVEVVDKGTVVRHLYIDDDWHTVTVRTDVGNTLDFEDNDLKALSLMERMNVYSSHFGFPLDLPVDIRSIFYRPNLELRALH